MPNINKWNFSNIKNKNDIIKECFSFIYLFNIPTINFKLEKNLYLKIRAYSYDFLAIEFDESYNDWSEKNYKSN